MRQIPMWPMTAKRVRMLMAAMGIAVFPAISSAALVAYEGFDYVVGKKVTNSNANANVNGGIGWANSWQSWNAYPSSVAADSLSFGTLTTVGNHFTTIAPTNGNGATRTLTTAVATAFNSAGNLTGVSRWISLVVRPETDTAENFSFSFGNSTQYAGPQYIQTVGGYYGFSGNSGFVSSGVAVATGVARFLVFKMDFVDATHTNGTLYINPTPGLVAPDVTGTSHAIKPFLATTSVGEVGTGWSLDEIRFGETYQDVAPVPEPTTISLLGIGGLALLRRRRRMG